MKGLKRILVTGGLGYVGGRVSQYLSNAGSYEILIGSRRAQAAPNWLPNGRVIEMASTSSRANLLAACAQVDVVLHLAAMNETDCARDPIGALETNGVFTIALLEAAKEAGVSRFIHLSTAHVYGAPLCGRIDESTCPRPVHPYASSHRAGEDAVLTALDRNEIAGIVLRLSNGFGAPASLTVNRWTLLVNDLCQQAVRGQKLVLRSSGLQRRDFITLHDVARAFEHMIELRKDAIGNGIFNVGGKWTPRIIDVANLVRERCLATLGMEPPITRPSPLPDEVTLDLDFVIDKLLASGFRLEGNAAREIDATLKLCIEG